MKAVMPKLGQAIETPGGMGQVISMQLLKELVTVRLDEQDVEVTFRCDELGLAGEAHQPNEIPEVEKPVSVPAEGESAASPPPVANGEPVSTAGRRRRRRRGRGAGPAR
jgi:hypothetical protein